MNQKIFEQLSSLKKKAKGHRLCIDFRYQEQPFQKNKYLFTKKDHTLQRVGFSNQISLHDSFLGYHQMIPLQINQPKDFFKFPWDSYMLRQIPPELEIVGDTFQKTMPLVLNFSTLVYMDDFINFF